MFLKRLALAFAIATLAVSTSLAEILPYNLEATTPDGTAFTGVAYVDTETADYLDEVTAGGGPTYDSVGIFLNAVTEIDVQSVATDGTIRTFSLVVTDPQDPAPVSSGGLILIPTDTEEPVDSAVCATDFAGDGTDAFAPSFFGLPADYAGAGVLVVFNAVDQNDVQETLLFAFACDGGSTSGELPTETLPGECVGYTLVTDGLLADPANIQPAVLTIGDQNVSVPEQIDNIVDSVVDLFNDGDVSYFGAVSILYPLLTAEFAYQNGFNVVAYSQLRRARSAVRRQIRRGQIDPEVGQGLVDSINETIDSLIDEILG